MRSLLRWSARCGWRRSRAPHIVPCVGQRARHSGGRRHTYAAAMQTTAVVSVAASRLRRRPRITRARTHTHTHSSRKRRALVCVCARVCVLVCVCSRPCARETKFPRNNGLTRAAAHRSSPAVAVGACSADLDFLSTPTDRSHDTLRASAAATQKRRRLRHWVFPRLEN